MSAARLRVVSPTEARNPRTLDIDTVPTRELLERLNAEDRTVAGAVRAVLPRLARAVDLAVERYRRGGTIHYVGAGTSGRIAVVDAAEVPATFCVPPERLVAHHAGGDSALRHAREAFEDDAAAGAAALRGAGASDVVVGVTASGRTPYVAGALETARAAGALTVLVTANQSAELARLASVVIAPDTGPEAVSGSTRLKAGTAQKLVLNGFSTALMVRLGKTYSNLMIDVVPANAKLRGRAVAILMEATGASEDTCVAMLAAAGGETRTALVCLLAGVDVEAARGALRAAGGAVRPALARLGAPA